MDIISATDMCFAVEDGLKEIEAVAVGVLVQRNPDDPENDFFIELQPLGMNRPPVQIRDGEEDDEYVVHLEGEGISVAGENSANLAVEVACEGVL